MEPAPRKYKRLRRIEAAGEARALNFACFQNQAFLKSERACRWLADAVARALVAHECDLWAWCFMPTHAHLLVFPRSEHPRMSGFLESIKKSVAKRSVAWVRVHAPGFLPRMLDEQPNGRAAYRFWQRGGGYDRNLWRARAIWNMIDYIHDNPVRDGLVARAPEWPWSSAAYYASRTTGPLPLTLDRLPRLSR